MENTSDNIIALERAALDRWGKSDPGAYLEIYAPEITYFDPITPHRIDGLDAMKAYYEPFTGKIKVDRYDMLDARVQAWGETAVLSFQLISYGKKTPDGPEITLARWNSTAVYRHTEAGWKTVHAHWSYIRPELKEPVLE